MTSPRRVDFVLLVLALLLVLAVYYIFDSPDDSYEIHPFSHPVSTIRFTP